MDFNHLICLEEAVVLSSQVKENMLHDLLLSQLILRTRLPNSEHPVDSLMPIKS